MKPTQIKQVSQGELRITWEDGHSSSFTTELLRKRCTCALCLHEAASGAITILLAGQSTIVKIDLSGHNAMIIHWGDGHKTGIYTWDFLQRLGTP